MMKKILLSGIAALGLAACGNGDSASAPSAPAASDVVQAVTGRDQIKIVGSSTVYPFATTVAETFGRSTSFKTPIVESTGSGGGLKLFCSGLGENHPDITNASRRIKASEVERCAKNGINDIVEVKVGYDGIVLANSRKSGQFSLSLREVFLALAKDIPNGNGGLTFDWIKATKKSDKSAYKAMCHTIREDDNFIEAGENDNLIVQKLNANPNALGIFGFGFLDQNADSVQGSIINGTTPTFENISDGSYPVSRSLYFYVKKANVGKVPGITGYLEEFMSDRATGPDGYLAEKGLIPMNATEQAEWKASVLALERALLLLYLRQLGLLPP